MLSSVCARCPHSPAGCCVAPPPLDWSDIGRILDHGGRDWLLSEIAAGNLRPIATGLSILRRKGRATADGPVLMKCIYHQAQGCSIPHNRRPATCNYYVCDAALEGPAAEVERARTLHDRLVHMFSRWDKLLARRIRTIWPAGPPYDEAFLDWLLAAFGEVKRASIGQ